MVGWLPNKIEVEKIEFEVDIHY